MFTTYAFVHATNIHWASMIIARDPRHKASAVLGLAFYWGGDRKYIGKQIKIYPLIPR